MYKRYERYKDSRVTWIADVPEHWEVNRLKDFSTIRRGTVDKSLKEDEIPVYLIQYTNVYYKREQKRIDGDYLPITVRENELRNSKVLKGDILVTASSETPDDIGRSSVIVDDLNNHVFGSDVLRIRIPETTMVLNYKKYLIENYVYLQIINSLCRGVTRFRFGMNDFKTIRYLIPPKNEQKAIANFLDRKTSKIDSLIADKEELIKKLEEYKQSIITEAVTKGLDPNVKMKDSGIEWIGEIPEHWSVSKVNRFYDICLGKMIQQRPLSPNDTLEKYLCAVNVTWNGVDISNIKEMWFSQTDKARYKLQEGDLVVCEGGEAGRASIWDGDIENCYIQNAVHRVRGKNNNLNKYLYYWLYFAKHIGYIDLLCSKATIMHLTREKLANLSVSIPDSKEQNSIVEYLDNKIDEISTLESSIKKHIQLLKSYRQSLIYEAVTGKIDVRDYQPERSEQLA